jgi:hypothetical protein
MALQAGAAVGVGLVVKRVLVIALLLATGCSSSSSCTTPRLVPSYLPAGLHRASNDALVGSARHTTWRSGPRFVQILEDVNADLGEDAKPTKVRGVAALYGPTGLPQAPLGVEWHDECGTAFAVLARGLNASEVVKIANGLRPR